jgi:hypothetical protein
MYEQARQLVDAQQTGAASLNDFFVNAIQVYLQLCERRRIDAEFAMMTEDSDYQKESIVLAEEFSASDWEALELIEGTNISTSEAKASEAFSLATPDRGKPAFIPVSERLYRLISAPSTPPAGKQRRIILEVLSAAKESLGVDQISAIAEAKGLEAVGGVTPSCRYHLNLMVKENIVEIVNSSDQSPRKAQ